VRYHTPDRRCGDDIQDILANRKARRDMLGATEPTEAATLKQKRAQQVGTGSFVLYFFVFFLGLFFSFFFFFFFFRFLFSLRSHR
jgi:hypothetical protein